MNLPGRMYPLAFMILVFVQSGISMGMLFIKRKLKSGSPPDSHSQMVVGPCSETNNLLEKQASGSHKGYISSLSDI